MTEGAMSEFQAADVYYATRDPALYEWVVELELERDGSTLLKNLAEAALAAERRRADRLADALGDFVRHYDSGCSSCRGEGRGDPRIHLIWLASRIAQMSRVALTLAESGEQR